MIPVLDPQNSKSSQDTPSSNVQGNEAEMCDDQLLKGLNFIPTCNKVDVARLKLELEQLGRMFHLK